MLVLTRKETEAIEISGPARIVVQRIKGGRVRIGIEAAATTRVLRGELLEQEDRKDAA